MPHFPSTSHPTFHHHINMPAITTNTPTTTTTAMDDYAERLQKSREFGAAHRANIEASIAQQEAELEMLQNDHAVLRAVIQHRTHAQFDSSLSISPPSAQVLATNRVCPTVALALLEIIAMRRNILYTPEQQTSTLLQNVMSHAEMNWQMNDRETRFDQLECVHSAWAEAEDEISTNHNSSNNRHPPRRCSRCQKMKLAGSGHGRSACDDGIAVSLSVPYPAISPVAVLSDVATDVSE